MTPIRTNWCIKLLLAAVVAATFVPSLTRADVIIDWNMKSDEIAAQKQILPFNHSRGTAMLHVAMFEAVNAVEGRYLPYKLNLTADRNTSKEVAAATAGHAILLALYPDQQNTIDATLASMLTSIADGEAKTKGIDLGKKAAAEIIALRAYDGANAQETYRPHTSPGVYVPTVVFRRSPLRVQSPHG
jgi:hypothetical protein